MRPFVISSIGRTGTMFLTDLCNLSPTHTVEHEWQYHGQDHSQYKIGRPEQYLRAVRDSLLDEHPLCHINPYLRYNLSFFEDCAFTAIIYRNIREVIVSTINRTREEEWETVMTNQVAWYKYYHSYLRDKQHEIRFDLMTTNLPYLQLTLLKLGISDVTITPEMMSKKVNDTKTFKVSCWEEVPKSIQKIVNDSHVAETEDKISI